uniref:RING-CH-type domain-containing protein n=1 Tax=Chrysocystis fragilis TaxID=1411660 RepID=A0A7S0TF13_9STRA
MISPCECKGGQRWVHEACLRRWQRMVLVSQPTHPMFHGDELRHSSCNVCKTEFTCAPPTRHELMQSFTGPEIAALIDAGCVIGSGDEFSAELEAQLASMPAGLRAASSYEHWLRSAYLITDVEVDDGLLSLEVETSGDLERLREAVERDSLVFSLHGRRLRLAKRAALAESDDVAGAFFERLRAPATVVFEAVDDDGAPLPRTCGDDHVSAVNLCRAVGAESARARRAVQRALDGLEKRRGKAWAARCAAVDLRHHVGGPCDERRVVKCLVLGAAKSGYKIVADLGDALFLAARLVKACEDEARPELGPGRRACLQGLRKNPDLNGKHALLLRRQDARWLVRVADVDDRRLVAAKPENLVVPTDDDSPRPFRGTVYAFWGDARWSRTQLLGEIARGHWGMCRHTLAEILAPPRDRRPLLDARLIFAPLSAMTEESIARARTQMLPLRDQARLAAAAVRAADDDDDDDQDPRQPALDS